MEAYLSKDMLSWEPVRMVASPMQMEELHNTDFSCMTASLELSNLDMLLDHYIGVLLFYDVLQAHDDHLEGPPAGPVPQGEPARRLLHALEELLLHYPCAAGVLVHNEIDGRLEVRYPKAISNAPSCEEGGTPACKIDQSPAFIYGVHFHVAHANATLAELGDVSIPHPSLDLLYPSQAIQGNGGNGRPLPRFVMAFQVTTFKCGGFSLGHFCSHAYADGDTVATFLQNLCSIARGRGLVHPPSMSPSRRMVIRPRDPPLPTIHYKNIEVRKRSTEEHPPLKHLHLKTATRYVFTMDALEALRARASKLPGQCSRNQALMALLWVAYARVSLKVHRLPGSHEMDLRFPINLRTKKCVPDLTEGYVGNALCFCVVPATIQELCESPLADVADKIKRSTGELDFGEGLQSLVDYVELQLRDGLGIPSPVDSLGMPSLVGLPFYDTDCGWGPPMYVGRPSQQASKRCIIMDHPAARAWNVLAVFSSSEEHTCFQESIVEFL